MRKSAPAPSASATQENKRQRQFSEVIRALVAEFFERELEFPKGVLVTVTEVALDADFNEARIGVSVLPPASGERCLAVIQQARGSVQHEAGKKLTAYRIPKFMFYLDTKLEETDRMERLLDTVKDSG